MSLLQEVRYGYRMWKKTPVITLVTVFSLALAIAANTTMYALAGGLIFAPFPYEEQERLVVIETADKDDSSSDSWDQVSPPDFMDLQAGVTSFSGLCAWDDEPMVVSGFEQPEAVLITSVTYGLFDVLGVEPLIGRDFLVEDELAENSNTLVLDYGYWMRRYNGEESVLGEILILNQTPFTIIGVMEEEFNLFQGDVAAYRPRDLTGFTDRNYRDLLVFGRLGEGITVEQAQAEVTVISNRLQAEYPESNQDQSLMVSSLKSRFPGRTDTLLITMAMVVTFLGLLIACANIANLLLSKAGTRMKEVAIRMTLGARRAGLFRQFLVESVLLGVFAGILGIFLAWGAVKMFQTGFPADVPRAFLPVIDMGVLMASAGLSVLAGLLFGLAPAFFTSVKDLRGALSDGGRTGTHGRRWRRVRHAFVIGEVAIALGVLAGAGLMADIFSKMLDHEPGFNPDGLITFDLALPEYRYADSDAILQFQRQLLPELAGIPGVEGVAVMNRLPRDSGYSSTSFNVAGQIFEESDERPMTGFLSVNDSYLSAMQGILLSGRFLEPGDLNETGPVIVVNQSFVDVYLDTLEVLGTRIEAIGSSREIVGVIANICQERIPTEFAVNPMIYIPLEQYPLRFPTIALRSNVDRARVAESARLAIWKVDAQQPVGEMRNYREMYRASLGAAAVFGDFLFAICAMVVFLAAMGIFGVISHAVLLKTREIGIRISVGARAGQVVSMITRQGIWLTVKGFILGAPLVYLMIRFVRVIFEFAGDMRLPLTGLLTIVFLALIALLSSWLPARRAAKIEPIEALNAE